jgi:putative endonuclease
LYSIDVDRYYVGSTNDLERRLQDHNRGKNQYTKHGKKWTLKYQCRLVKENH